MLIRANQKITLNVKKSHLGDVLLELLRHLRIDYEVSGSQILLKRAAETGQNLEMNSSATPSVPDNINVSGTVTYEKGGALPGINVVLKNTQRGTTTDVNSMYRLVVPDQSTLLVFSFVGYQSQEIAIGARAIQPRGHRAG